MSSKIIKGSYRRKKYPTEVEVNGVKNKEDGTEGEIFVITDESQRSKRKIKEILVHLGKSTVLF